MNCYWVYKYSWFTYQRWSAVVPRNTFYAICFFKIFLNIFKDFYKYQVLQIHVVTTLTNLLSRLLLVRSAAGVPPACTSNRWLQSSTQAALYCGHSAKSSILPFAQKKAMTAKHQKASTAACCDCFLLFFISWQPLPPFPGSCSGHGCTWFNSEQPSCTQAGFVKLNLFAAHSPVLATHGGQAIARQLEKSMHVFFCC